MKYPPRSLATVGVAATIALAVIVTFAATGAHAGEKPAYGKNFLLMVWDGLRPDLVGETSTPTLLKLARTGVRFVRHHSIYPTITMVNAAGLATGATPGDAGIYGDVMYLAPVLDLPRTAALPMLGPLLGDSLFLERSQYLAELNDPRAFGGR